jgi:hypothetical protein
MARLPAFALPFVTRSLRGARAKRYAVLSLVLAGLSFVVGAWLAFGPGDFERDFRGAVGLEEARNVRQLREFTIYAEDGSYRAAARCAEAQRRGREGCDYPPVLALVLEGQRRAGMAIATPANTAAERALQARARELVGEYPSGEWGPGFDWSDPTQVESLERIVDAGGVPSVERYSSPLGLSGFARILALLSGLCFALSATVLAPLLVATSHAQERHENTLMPLLGTALSPRELALGLAAGPLAVVAIFALPQLLIFGLSTLLARELAVGVVFVAATSAAALAIVFLVQLFAHVFGRRRTPGVIGVSLVLASGFAWLVGVGFAAALEPDTVGISAVMPYMGITTLLAGVLGPIHHASPHLFTAVAVGAGGALIFAWLAATALARKLETRDQASLTRREALAGALTSVVMVDAALPIAQTHVDGTVRFYLGMAMLAAPMALLLMARVPASEIPAKLRRVPVFALLGEFATWGMLHLVVASVIDFDASCWHPVALGWLAWCVLVLGLLAIRVAAVPANTASNLWPGFCAASLAMGFGQAVGWGAHELRGGSEIFALVELSPVLGLLQVVATIGIPASLLLHLSKKLGSIESKASNPHQTR